MTEIAGGKTFNVRLVAQIGLPIRGVSPYSDALYRALMAETAATLECRVVVMDFASAMPGALYPGGTPEHAVRRGVAWWNPLSWLRAATGPAQVVHLQYWTFVLSTYFLFIAVLCKLCRKRVIVTVHNPEAHERLRIFSLFERPFLNFVDLMVVHGRRGEGALARRLGNAASERIRRIPHGVMINGESGEVNREMACRRLGLAPRPRYVCMFGNLRGYKGVDVLLEAWREIEDDFQDVILVIAGRMWGESSGLRGLVGGALGLRGEASRIRAAFSAVKDDSRVKLMDRFIDDEEIDALLAISEFAVFPYTRFSSQSGAAARAAGCGCPVLVSDAGELPDLAISPDWIVTPGDVPGLAEAMGERLRHRFDMRAVQRQRVFPFEWQQVARAHLRMYASAVQDA